ncbi:PadR family transcriptional regulator [Actinophytocola oryzae]|uniref:PadR family transcriptional regulator n=1 Tax=Actinophytocola oryzae TaxID=502181 RepID=A0A4R7V4Q1_9PSEU|nr:PadR family transcriptional regulator [Actinophytocola oryzae]TDV43662.1 PadR family transcriptional regulator [Actinophytocola oryzae]
MTTPRMTLQTQAVLAVLLERESWGFDLSRESGLPAGTIYPILRRLTSVGWVTSRWEQAEAAQEDGRPPRRYYSLTTEGRARATNALAEAAKDRGRLTGLLAPQPGQEHA